MKNNTKSRHKGFTIIELLIATSIFSVALIVVLSSFMQIGRMFYKGVSINNVHEATSSLVDDISNDLKLAKSYSLGGNINATAKYFCIGLHRYAYNVDTANSPSTQQVRSSEIPSPDPANPKGVIRSQIPVGCPAPGPSDGATKNEQLLGPDMRLNDFGNYCNNTDPSTGAPGTCGLICTPNFTCRIHVSVVFYGPDHKVFISSAHPDPLNDATDADLAYKDPDAHCSGALISTQFCAASEVNAIAGLRE